MNGFELWPEGVRTRVNLPPSRSGRNRTPAAPSRDAAAGTDRFCGGVPTKSPTVGRGSGRTAPCDSWKGLEL